MRSCPTCRSCWPPGPASASSAAPGSTPTPEPRPNEVLLGGPLWDTARAVDGRPRGERQVRRRDGSASTTRHTVGVPAHGPQIEVRGRGHPPRYQQTGGRAVASTENPQPANAGEALERLGRLSLRGLSMEDLLQTVADLTKTVMPGNPEASVLLLVKDHPSTVVSTGALATALDETQYERGHGPCLHAARTGEVTEIPDTRAEDRWPDYTPRAVEHGNLSSLSIPLTGAQPARVSAPLNISARRANAFDGASRSVATRFAPYAAVATGN